MPEGEFSIPLETGCQRSIITIMKRLFFRGSFTLFIGVPALAFTLYARSQRMTPLQFVERALRQHFTGRQAYDDLQAAASYWYEARNPSDLPAMDEALEKVLPAALKQAPMVTNFQTWETAHQFKAYHDAGAVLLAKCYTLLYYGEVETARPFVKLLTEKLPFAMVLKPNRTVTWTRDSIRYHEHMCAMYAAIVTFKMGTVVFPPERDEFDGPEQRLACRHMAILRLKEGDYESVERWAQMADTQKLRTCSGDWAINLIYDSMQPWEGELHSEAAWTEIGNAIRTWQAKKPQSVCAKIAEASFLSHWAAHATEYNGAGGYPDFRERSDRGRKIMEGLKPEGPAWYSIMITLMGQTGASLEDMARVFSAGLEKYPAYSPIYNDLCIGFARSGDNGGAACAAVIHHLVGDGHPAQAARVLWRLCDSGDLATVQARLDPDDSRTAIQAALAAWPDSLELRSDFGYVATSLSQPDLARKAMRGMAGKWDRATWSGREDLAMRLCEQKVDSSVSKATPVPMAHTAVQ